jgi:hypothetical protein
MDEANPAGANPFLEIYMPSLHQELFRAMTLSILTKGMESHRRLPLELSGAGKKVFLRPHRFGILCREIYNGIDSS